MALQWLLRWSYDGYLTLLIDLHVLPGLEKLQGYGHGGACRLPRGPPIQEYSVWPFAIYSVAGVHRGLVRVAVKAKVVGVRLGMCCCCIGLAPSNARKSAPSPFV